MTIRESGLSRRDWILLPCLSLLTIVVLLSGSEATARHFFASKETDSCAVSDANIGYSFRPNCISRMKAAEGPWVTNHYNDCGYRSGASCGPRLAGTSRIALIGSSASEGLYVDYDHTFATRTATALTGRCHRPVEVQNLGRKACSPACTFHRIDEALALQPDVLVMSVSPHDFELMQSQQVIDRYKPIGPQSAIATEYKKLSVMKQIQKLMTESRSVVAAEHFMFQDPATYLKMYLVYGDRTDSLRQPFSAAWQRRFADFDLLLGEMADKAHAAHVPFYLMEIPSLSQVSIVSMSTPPAAHLDADAINRELAGIAARHGVVYVNVLDSFRRTPGSNRDFYTVDGHENADGEALISASLVEALTADKNSSFAGCDVPVETALPQAMAKVELK